MRKIIRSIFLLFPIFLFFSCTGTKSKESDGEKDNGLRQVLYVQSLYNTHPDEDIVPEIQATVDSMRSYGRTPYYYAAVNVLIDCLFSEGRFAEADSLAVKMQYEANLDSDSLSMAMAKRVRAQMFYKLSQPSRALQELQEAPKYISNPYRSGSDFGTATSIQEWLWIISRELGDTASMNKAGLIYAWMVEENERINSWTDTTGHYPVSALAFKAEDSFARGEIKSARELLDSASLKIIPSLPSRAYEHFYAVRCLLRTYDADWQGAISDADTLLNTHKEFPSFYLKDLLLKARILNLAGQHEESAKVYSEYVGFHDSLSNKITAKRLHDLTVLYRSELSREQKRSERLRIYALGAVILLLVILLIVSLLNAAKEKKRNRLLVERLKEQDRVTENAYHNDTADESSQLSMIERLDRHIRIKRPYTDPALGRKELAEVIGISQDALGQLIKDEKGTSVKNYINSFRLEEARRILGLDFEVTVADLAASLGFGTARTLQRAFKERYDMTPTQYREAAREIQNTD